MSLNTVAPSYATGQVVTAAQLNALQDGIQAPWTAYTPAWTATVTNPTIGNGAVVGAYNQVGKTLIGLRVRVTFGSTTTLGSGSYLFSTPATFSASDALMIPARFFDSSAGARYKGIVYSVSGGNFAVAVDVGTAGGVLGGVTNSSPVVWATSDTIEFGLGAELA